MGRRHCADDFLVGDADCEGDTGAAVGGGNERISAGDDGAFIVGDSQVFVFGSGVTAGSRNDVTTGSTGQEFVIGAGNDLLDGGAATDDCAGEGGHDTIVRCELTSAAAPGVTTAEPRAVLGFTPMVDRRPRRHGN